MFLYIENNLSTSMLAVGLNFKKAKSAELTFFLGGGDHCFHHSYPRHISEHFIIRASVPNCLKLVHDSLPFFTVNAFNFVLFLIHFYSLLFFKMLFLGGIF